MKNTTIQKLNYDVKKGKVEDIYCLFLPDTINTGAQISAARIKEKELQKKSFYTANASLATKRNGELLLGIGGNSSFNVVFGRDTKNKCQELNAKFTNYIHLDTKEKDDILMLEQKGDVVFVNPKYMDLKGRSENLIYRYFKIRTDNYDKDVTVARMPWISAGYGSGYMLGKVMHDLNVNQKIPETTIFVINPDHAAENVEDNEMIARACWLSDVGRSPPDSHTDDRDVGNPYSSMRGVFKESTERKDVDEISKGIEGDIETRIEELKKSVKKFKRHLIEHHGLGEITELNFDVIHNRYLGEAVTDVYQKISRLKKCTFDALREK